MRFLMTLCLLFGFTMTNAQQEYPNIEGEVLLEDDRIVVQRFVLPPGQDEGIHEHPEHQLVIVLNSTEELVYEYRGSKRVFTLPDDQPSDKMEAFWRPGPVYMSDKHNSRNTGTQPLEWIAISFKSESIATDNPPAQFVDPDAD